MRYLHSSHNTSRPANKHVTCPLCVLSTHHYTPEFSLLLLEKKTPLLNFFVPFLKLMSLSLKKSIFICLHLLNKVVLMSFIHQSKTNVLTSFFFVLKHLFTSAKFFNSLTLKYDFKKAHHHSCWRIFVSFVSNFGLTLICMHYFLHSTLLSAHLGCKTCNLSFYYLWNCTVFLSNCLFIFM